MSNSVNEVQDVNDLELMVKKQMSAIDAFEKGFQGRPDFGDPNRKGKNGAFKTTHHPSREWQARINPDYR